MTTHRPVRFVHRGRIQEVHSPAPTRTVLQWLREEVRCMGTKEGCAEGDCGACTVLVAELAHAGSAPATRVGELSVRPVNACIRFLPTLDGKALLTVEDLAPNGQLHPAQQAMVECHGSQCGFCTPGFVMSLAALHEQHGHRGEAPTREALADGLAGNLCRCTGYRPILDAGMRMSQLAGPGLETKAIAEQLRSLQQDAPLEIDTPAGRYRAPRDSRTLGRMRAQSPEAKMLGGATDMGLWVTKQFKPLPDLLYTGEVAEMKRIAQADGLLHIGAAVPLEDAWAALARHWPGLQEAWLRFAGPPVRHAGTLGGNVANGSPIGDGAPVLMALDARLQLQCGDAVRTLPLQDFYLGYMKNALQPGEFLLGIEVPLPQPGWQVQAYKVSKRHDDDISSVFGAFALHLVDDEVRDVRLAYGGLAATVKRAAQAEAALRGQPWNEATLQRAQAALAQEFQPLTDHRASAAYRAAVAGALLRRLWLATRADAPVPAHLLQVAAHARVEGAGHRSTP